MRSPAVPLFLIAGLGAVAGLVVNVPVWPLAVLALLGFVASLMSNVVVGRALALALLAAALGAAGGAWQRTSSRSRTLSLPDDSAVYDAVVADVTFGKSGGRRLILDVEGLIDDGGPRAFAAVLAATLPAADQTSLLPGDRVRVRGKAHALEGALSPGTLDEARLGLARGIDASLVVVPGNLAVMARDVRSARFARWRLSLRERMTRLLPPRMAGLELALLVGDTSLLDDDQREIYRTAGAGHLLAVSGLQVSLLAILFRQGALAVVMATSYGRRGRGRLGASIAALVGVWAFVALCGLPPSAVRAAAMATAVLLAPMLGRRTRSLDALGIAGLFTVLASPASVLDPSFLLSYAAVLGLAASAVPAGLDDAHGGLRRALTQTVVASVGAGIVTLPLSAWLFGTVAPAGLIANIVLVPAATFLQVPALALGLAGAVLDVRVLAWLGAETALVLEALTAGLGDLLPAVRAVDAPSGAATIMLIACAFALAAALARRQASLGGAAVAAAVLTLWVARHEPSGVRITALPVGQGDGAVIELPDGAVIVIDGGGTYDGRADPGTDVMLPFLARRGVRSVDLMILSHPHPDHAKGLVSVAHALPVKELWTNGSDAPLARDVEDAVGGAARATTPALLGTHMFHGATLDVLAPAPAEKTSLYPELEANDNSLVVRICWQGDCALWPGDVEALGEDLLLHSASPPSLRAAVVKAPHHGSRTSSTEAFVKATGAHDVILCTGPGNTFGFPHPSTVERWRAAGARLWDTARNGETRIYLTGHGARVESFAD